MAAITPHLERQGETDPSEETVDRQKSPEGLGDAFGEGPLDTAPRQLIEKSHMELLNMVWVRAAVSEDLKGLPYRVQNGDAYGKDMRSVYIILDRPIGEGPAWNPVASPNARQFQVLSWTTKMSCPSFSLPAGAPDIGGACPGASAGQSVVPIPNRKKALKLYQDVTHEPVRLSRTICNRCYAEGGQYSTSQVQFAQMLRFAWTKEAVSRRLFAPTMIAAIYSADFKLDGGTIKLDEHGLPQQALKPEASKRRFFRIHDSGDFYSIAYLEEWKRIADALPDITFWAPTRVWALGDKWIDAVDSINRQPKNLIIRPSAYHVNEPPPRRLADRDKHPGWAAGSTVYHASMKREAAIASAFTWDCPVYSIEDPHDKHTCRNGRAPAGHGDANGIGCRACWVQTDDIVNYTEH